VGIIGEDEVYNLLEKEKKEMTIEEISRHVGVNRQSVWKSLKRLLKYGDLNCRKKTKEEMTKEGKQYTGRAMVFSIIIEIQPVKKQKNGR
jgi:predicted transcriptional regulator